MEGEDAVRVAREMAGTTDPKKALISIRETSLTRKPRKTGRFGVLGKCFSLMTPERR
ncbi:MAG: hypothetical protein OD815_001189 [Candidatus Alkanophagales archaeon MCA70_species_2]|nr:hypothetical protein [Candidatus Alkanophaga liquidiphilum]